MGMSYCNFATRPATQLAPTCHDVYPLVDAYYQLKPSLDQLPVTVFCTFHSTAGTLQLPQSCSNVYPKVDGFHELKPSLADPSSTTFCSYLNGAVTLKMPRNCSDVYPKVDGFHELKPSLDDSSSTTFCSFLNGTVFSQIPKTCDDVHPKRNGFSSLKPSEESKTKEWFCYYGNPPVGYPKSCTEVFPQTNGSHVIKASDSVDPFQVSCEFTQDKAVTVFHHDSENEVEVTCDPPSCHKRNLHFENSLEQMLLVVQQAEQCEQYIKYRCYHTHIGDNYAGFVSRDGTIKRFSDGYCACGIEGNCVRNLKCNCMMNDSDWRFDEIYVNLKSDLPIQQVMFGNAMAYFNDHGYHTVRPLKCISAK